MTRIYPYFICCLLFFAMSLPSDYRSEISAAHQFIKEQQMVIDAVAEEFPENNNRQVIATVFPELIRYELFRNFFETKALEIGYVNGGSKTVDFSIGPFQMKPSFIELLEYHVQYTPELAERLQFIGLDENYSPRQARSIRVARLKSFEWQCRYAHVFQLVLRHCYNQLASGPDIEWLRFSATAYNYGFHRPYQEILQWMDKKAFPYGPKFHIEQAAFASFSELYYQQAQP